VKRTLYLPDHLDRRVRAHLRTHPKVTFSRLVQDALERHLGSHDLGRLLRLAGMVKSAPPDARSRAEDRLIARER